MDYSGWSTEDLVQELKNSKSRLKRTQDQEGDITKRIEAVLAKKRAEEEEALSKKKAPASADST